MIELNEERELKEVINAFTQAVKVFNQKDYRKAGDAFGAIAEKYKNSEYYSVLETQGRAKVYQKICQSQAEPFTIELNSDEDYLQEGIFNLNAGKYPRAIELLSHLEGKEFQKNYVHYLLGIAYHKNSQTEAALTHLKKAVDADSSYKLIMFNEPDFDNLHENEEFLHLVALR